MLADPRTIRERRQNREIAESSVVFFIKGNKVAQSLFRRGIKAPGVWYRVEAFTNAGPDSRCELCCGWGHIENKCGNKPKCGYCSSNHRASDHKCNLVGCAAKQGSLCGHTLEMCPNCRAIHIAFSSRCAKKSEAFRVARQSGKTGTVEWAPTNETTHTATGTNGVVLGHRHRAGGEADGGREEKADAKDEEATGQASDVMMSEAEIATSTASETEAGTLATNEWSDPAQLRKVVRADHCGAGDWSRTQGGRSLLARAPERTGGFGFGYSAYEIRKRQRVWTAIRRGSGLVVDERTD